MTNFLTQIYRMASEDLEYSSKVIWTTFMKLFNSFEWHEGESKKFSFLGELMLSEYNTRSVFG